MDLYNQITKGLTEGWKIFISPTRFKYKQIELGYPNEKFSGVQCRRRDMVINNNRGHNLQCSLYEPQGCDTYPVVVYLHGNCGNRKEAYTSVKELLPQNIAVFCFDFAGTGNSEGEYISLGWYEALDLIVVIEKIRQMKRVKNITLWGRSMGAVTALLYTSLYDQNVTGLILDSPFSSIRELTCGHIESRSGLPRIFSNMIYKFLKSQVKDKIDLDMDQLAPIDHVANIKIPCLFISGLKDVLVPTSNVKELYKKSTTKIKFFSTVQQGHNGKRQKLLTKDCVKFIHYVTRSQKKGLFLETAIHSSSFEEEVKLQKRDFQKHKKTVGGRRKQALLRIKRKLQQKVENYQQKQVSFSSTTTSSDEDFADFNEADFVVKKDMIQNLQQFVDKNVFLKGLEVDESSQLSYLEGKEEKQSVKKRIKGRNDEVPFQIDQSMIQVANQEESVLWDDIDALMKEKSTKKKRTRLQKKQLTKEDIRLRKFKYFKDLVNTSKYQISDRSQDQNQSIYFSNILSPFTHLLADKYTERLKELKSVKRTRRKTLLKRAQTKREVPRRRRRIFDKLPEKATIN